MFSALYRDALAFAEELREPLNSFHFLLALFVTPSQASELLERHMVSTGSVTSAFKRLRSDAIISGKDFSEPSAMAEQMRQSLMKSGAAESDIFTPMNLLFVITGLNGSIAKQVLDSLGVSEKLRMDAGKKLSLFFPDIADVKQRIPQKPRRRKDDRPTDEQSNIPSVFEKFGRNLTELAQKGVLDYAWGREEEQESIIDILGRRRNNNPLIIGAPGTGKTALVEGIAARQHEGLLPHKIIWELQIPLLIGGTNLRGALEERITELLRAVERMKDRLIVFIDEIHLINSEGNEQLASLLKPALARGEFPLIGATTVEEFNAYIAKDQAIERRFTVIRLEEPSGERLERMVIHAAGELSRFHGVSLDAEQLIKTAVTLSNRYISGRSQPDKVISLLDTLGAILKRERRTVAEESDITELVSKRTGIPKENLLIDGRRVITDLPLRLDAGIVGQNPAKRKIVQLLGRRFVAGNGKRPIASFIFAGPTGTGKTEIAKILAEFFYGNRDKMVVFDMSEFQEQHTVSRLIGSPPGYTGYEEGGRLTEAFRREPYQLLLLDEVEKAHPKILTLLLQILEEGRIADSRGFTVSLSEAIVVLTTNLGADALTTVPVGFGAEEKRESSYGKVLQVVEQHISPELLNRIDEVAVFDVLTDEELIEIAIRFIATSVAVISKTYGVSIAVDDARQMASDFVEQMSRLERGQGARGIRRRVEKGIEEAVMNRLYGGEPADSLRLSPGVNGRPTAE